ncbi:MAG: DUF4435 domain-containing protein [Prevotella sp.]
MSRRLSDNITSLYVEAANKMTSKKARRKIVAYVESYDDILFWRTVLSRFEDDTRFFEVMLPSKKVLVRGKKSVLMNFIGNRVGPDMIACVDADYDYLQQGRTETSRKILTSPYVFHTYVYAIENYQCYADNLHNVAVMVTLNDHAIFDFKRFLREYSEICYPLFVWSIWAYRSGHYMDFSMTDFDRVVELGGFNLQSPSASLEHLRHKVEKKVHWLQQHYPKHLTTVAALDKEMREKLGVTPQTTYLYMHGHHVFDAIVAPIMTKVCNRLRMERESEISRTAVHRTQMHNELSCYENSLADVKMMLKKNIGYMACPQFQRLQEDVENYLVNENLSESPKS